MTILTAQDDQKVLPIPQWVTDLSSFRRWAYSDEFPKSGWYAFLGGDLWVDANMEKGTHNQLKSKITLALTELAESAGIGRFFADRMLLTHVDANLSTEPDGMFLSYDAIRAGRARLEKGLDSLEVVGTPDMTLEVISPTSVRKDRVILRELYHAAGIPEYWVAEAENDSVVLEILVWAAEGYRSMPDVDGWLQSPVFGKAFRITSRQDPLGLPMYTLEQR